MASDHYDASLPRYLTTMYLLTHIHDRFAVSLHTDLRSIGPKECIHFVHGKHWVIPQTLGNTVNNGQEVWINR